MAGTDLAISAWHGLVTTFIVLQVVATLAFGVRLGTGKFITRKIGPQDYALIAAWFVKFNSFAYILTMSMVKFSYSPFLLSSFDRRRAERVLIYLVLCGTFFTGFLNGMFTLLTCGYPAGVFGISSNCGLWQAYNYIATIWSIVDVIGNVAFTLLSIHAFKPMDHPRSIQFAGSIVGLLGVIAMAASGFRIAVLVDTQLHLDYAATIRITTLAVVEMGLALAAVSLFSTRPLLEKMLERWERRRRSAVIDVLAPEMTTVGEDATPAEHETSRSLAASAEDEIMVQQPTTAAAAGDNHVRDEEKGIPLPG
ncbi:hypothetical protein ANO11243_013260 [Dothideomycetidae sp. 11243]|nr:hypothetical protein ANO11243_013260 [fungal sp. No.11243]